MYSYTFKISKEQFDNPQAIKDFQWMGVNENNYLFSPADEPTPDLPITMWLYIKPGLNDVFFSCEETDVPEAIKMCVDLNKHAEFVSFQTGWNGDDFQRNRKSVKITFKIPECVQQQ